MSKEGIKLPVTSRKRQVHWHEVEQVLLRYGILTIDCHNNRLFQYHVEPAGVDKEAFENYCSDNVTAILINVKKTGSHAAHCDDKLFVHFFDF